ncbi:hypothetical protein XA68_14008 [Ophiocordyceps unilateralis]|uniref:Peptidase M60 domain-containing protein n=1 Tax=Ophiocordyceps unilateralis TaxID=268505 RepID=A0A2A9P9Y5_OPHUN|nr:hypothetical protein XA68_14008 [Ophiocordyceps unilateralis]
MVYFRLGLLAPCSILAFGIIGNKHAHDDTLGEAENFKRDVELQRLSDPDTSGDALAALQLYQQAQSFYPQQEQSVSIKVVNKGSAENLWFSLESPILANLNLNITEMGPGCSQTTAGSKRIRCEWLSVHQSEEKQVHMVLKYHGPFHVRKVEVPLTLTAYLDGPNWDQVDTAFRLVRSLRWEVRRPQLYRYIVDNDKHFPQPRAMNITAVPRSKDEMIRLRQWFQWTDFYPTGFYLRPRMPLQLIVLGGSAQGPLPELLIGTPALVNPWNRADNFLPGQQRSKLLRYGVNTVTCPVGGIMYIRYAYELGSRPPPDITVVLYEGTAAQPFPLFRQGITTDKEWKTMLAATTVPFAELAGRRVIVTGLAADARKYASMGQRQGELLDTYDKIITAQDRISGLFRHGAAGKHRPSPLRPMVVQTSNGLNANAWHFRAALPAMCHGDVWWQPEVENSWLLWHELGHQRQHVHTWSWQEAEEVTVNIYSLAVRRLRPDRRMGHGSAREWAVAKDFLAEWERNQTVDFDHADHFVQLAMFDQLRQVFGDTFYHELHIMSRESTTRRSSEEKKHYFMTRASWIVQEDLSEYFEKWGMQPGRATLQWLQGLPKPEWDYTSTPAYTALEEWRKAKWRKVRGRGRREDKGNNTAEMKDVGISFVED